MADNTLGIHKVVVLSTAHISPADDALLHDEEARVSMLLDYQPYCTRMAGSGDLEQTGWLIRLNSEPWNPKRLLEIGFSYDFAALLDMMSVYGSYLLLDRDGPINPDLPTFYWS